MRDGTRRQFIQSSAVTGILLTGGCLRLDSNDDSSSTSTELPKSQDGNIPVRVTDTWGPASQREVRWESDRIFVRCGDTNPPVTAVEDGTVDATVDIATGTVNMSELERVVYVYRHRSTAGIGLDREEARQDVSYFGIVKDPNNVGQKTIEDDASELEPDNPDVDFSLYIKNKDDTGRVEREVDTATIDGTRHLGVGANTGSDTAQQVTLEVFDIKGIDANDEVVFSLNPPAKRLELL